MNPTLPLSNPALASLNDIHTPEVIGWWPVASGYWIALVLFVTLIVCLYSFIKRYRQHRIAKKEALIALKAISPTNPHFAVEVNAILKRAAMSYVGREQVASLDGESWYQWLDSYLPTQQRNTLNKLLDKRYQPHSMTEQEANQLAEFAAAWIKKVLPIKKEAKC